MKLIQKFEWEKLKVEGDFTADHHKALIGWQERQQATQKPGEKATYFNVGVNSVTFTQWVGVIQVKNLTIEVLPKAESPRSSESQAERKKSIGKWSSALLRMLQMAGRFPIRYTENADLKTRPHSLLDLYFSTFLDQVETLIHQGLVKTYHRETTNRTVLKGKLDFAGQIRKNLVHQERFYTTASQYDRDNVWNRILHAAIDATVKNCSNGGIRSRAQNLILAFPDWQPEKFEALDFSRLAYSRKTDGYQAAMNLARLILLEMNPTAQSGKEKVIALFFDMNILWEEYLLALFRIAANGVPDVTVEGKQLKEFWEYKRGKYKWLETDILIKLKNDRLVFDAKWKLPKNSLPEDADIRQMFAYNLIWNSRNAWLLYPQTAAENNVGGDFIFSSAGKMGMSYIPVEKNTAIDRLKALLNNAIGN